MASRSRDMAVGEIESTGSGCEGIELGSSCVGGKCIGSVVGEEPVVESCSWPVGASTVGKGVSLGDGDTKGLGG